MCGCYYWPKFEIGGFLLCKLTCHQTQLSTEFPGCLVSRYSCRSVKSATNYEQTKERRINQAVVDEVTSVYYTSNLSQSARSTIRMLQSRWVVGVHEQQHEQRNEEKSLLLLEELEKNIKIQKDTVQSQKPLIPMIGMDKEGKGLEIHPPLQPNGPRDDDEMDQEESSSEVTEQGGLGVSGELDDSGEAS